MENKLEQVAVRIVDQPPLYSTEPMNTPQAAIRVMQDFLSQMDREYFCIVNLQADLTPINMNIVSMGTLDQALVHPREVFKTAILSNAASMLLIHNHPSGNLEPSANDIAITDRLQKAGQLLGIQVQDHIIVSRGMEFYSLREQDRMQLQPQTYAESMDELWADGQLVAEAKPALGMPARTGDTENRADSATVPLPVPGKDLDSILKSLETGVADLFSSERYADYLKTMAKFHNYSFNNTLLIAMQRPDATLVTGYRNWQSMGRQVRKGEKGITIIAPMSVKRKQQRELLDEHRHPILNENGDPVMEEVEVTVPKFKAITVFDLAQTVGEPLELLAPEDLKEMVKDYEISIRAIREISPVPIRFDEINGTAKGYYDQEKKEIVIQKDMSNSQTLKTGIHENAHARLHDRDLMEEQGQMKDRLTKEVEAESVAYCVCSALGIDTSDYSFPYIAGWSSGKEMKELKASMDTIRQTAGSLIDELTEKIQELAAGRDQHLQTEQEKRLIPVMEAAGYTFDKAKSTQTQLRFVPDGVHQLSGVLYADSWDDVQSWLDKASIDDQFAKEKIQRALHPEYFEKTSEEMLYAMEGERYAIYQIKEGSDAEQYLYRGLDDMEKSGHEVVASDYECVYSDLLLRSDDLETLYSMFNDLPPADYKARFMSVSDVVVMNRNQELHAYYVDRFGFKELPAFALERRAELVDPESIEKFDLTKDSGCISFFTAECSEFHVLGEFHHDLTLKEAFDLYEKIPSDRMNGVKCIGFNLQDGSDYTGMFDLVVGDRVLKDTIDAIPYFRESVHVQAAVREAEKELKRRMLEKGVAKTAASQEQQKKPTVKRREECL